MREVAVGSTIHGHTLVEKIGEGHYGEVWRAEYLGHPVALKLFTRGRPTAHVKQEAFAQYALGRLPEADARWFPRVEHLGLDEDPAYVRMELIDGTPLENLLTHPSLSLEERLAIGERILQALAAVHRHGFIHGDLSPLNVLVTADRSVRLIDVGYGALFDEASGDIAVSTTAADRPMGVASPLYSAPERFRDDPVAGCGKPSDVFSFGKLLYRLITGEQPFVIKPVSLKFRALGAKWDDFLFRCLEERPEARFPDAAAALAEYGRINRPELAPGEYRAECPECHAAQSIPGGWTGERFDCRRCGRTIEVLFYDDPSRYATTALMDPAETPPIVFLDQDVEARARKFCPGCGGEVRVEARQCVRCGTWTDEEARRMAAEQGERRRQERIEQARRSFVLPALAAFAGYFFFWVPGVILNWFFLTEAEAVERRIGTAPPGLGALRLMFWVLVYGPLIAAGCLVGLVILFALVATLLRVALS